MKNKKRLVILGVLSVILIIAVLFIYIPSKGKRQESKIQTSAVNQKDVDPAKLNEVIIKNFAFVPDQVSVKKGTTITWKNLDGIKHSVVGLSGGPKSALLPTDGTYSYTFTQAGKYDYKCEPHPYMTGTVIVTE